MDLVHGRRAPHTGADGERGTGRRDYGGADSVHPARRFIVAIGAVLGAVALFIVSCGPAATQVQTSPVAQSTPSVRTSQAATVQTSARGVDAVFDPAAHRADDVRNEAEQAIRQISPPRVTDAGTSTASMDPALLDTAWVPADGYRIQLATSGTREQAEAAAERARERFPYDSVYVIFEAPWHKVRVGDAQTRDEAEKKLQEARQKGYRDAFWVPSMIRAMRVYREDEEAPTGSQQQ